MKCRIEKRGERFYVLIKGTSPLVGPTEFPVLTTTKESEALLMKKYYEES